MNLRLQNLIAILPVFLVIAAAGGGLKYYSEQEETYWGLKEEARSLVVGAAAFINGDAFEKQVREGVRGEALTAPYRDSLDRVLKWGKARTVYALDRSGKDVLFLLGSRSINELPAPSQDEMTRTDNLGAWVSDPVQFGPQEADGANLRMFGYANVVAKDGRVVARLGVETSASSVVTNSQAVLNKILWASGVIFLVGVLLAFMLSAIVRKRIIELTKAACELSAGKFQRKLAGGGIRELNDLSMTFNTMSSVLSDVVQKSSRSLVEAELYRDGEDINQAFNERFMGPCFRSWRGITCAARLANMRSFGDFFALVEGKNVFYAVTGKVREKDPTSALIASSAARRVTEDLLTELSPGQVFERVWDFAELDEWRCVMIKDAQHAEVWTYSQEKSGLTQSNIQLPDRGQLLVHTLRSFAASEVSRYLKSFVDLSADALIFEISPALEGETSGAVLLFGRGDLKEHNSSVRIKRPDTFSQSIS